MFTCHSSKWLAVLTLLTIVIGSFSMAAAANAVPLPPTVIAQAQGPFTVEAGDYILLGFAFTFFPGEYVGQHSHQGPDLVTVYEGEVINHKDGSDRIIKTGDSWLDQAGEQHAITNESDAKARIWACALLPVGDNSIAPSVQIPLNVKAGEYSLIGRVLDFAPGSGLPEQSHGGDVLFYVLEGEITRLENGISEQVKAFKSWTEVPNAIYSVTNTSGKNARVAVSMLLPKGAEETTIVSSPTPPTAQDVPNAGSPTLPATQNVPSSNSRVLPVLIGVSLFFIIVATGIYLRRRAKG